MYALTSILISLLVFGVVLWLINTYLPIDQRIKTVINIVAVIIVIVWLLRFLQFTSI